MNMTGTPYKAKRLKMKPLLLMTRRKRKAKAATLSVKIATREVIQKTNSG
jgi:hypothetical protein